MSSQEKREKKPPVSITEMKEGKEGEEHEQGKLSYLGENKDRGGGAATKSKINLTQLVLAVGLSILVFVLISNFWLTPKKDALVLLENQKLLENQQAGLEGSLLTESGRIDNVISAYATKAEIAPLANLPDQITSQFASLKTSLEGDIDSQIDVINTRVDELEDQIVAGVNTTTSNGAASGGVPNITVTPAYYGGSFIWATNSSSKVTPITLKVRNKEEYSVGHLELQVVVHSRGVPINLTSAVVSGGWPLIWEKVYMASGVVVLRGYTPEWGEGLELVAGDSESIYLTLELAASPVPITDITFYVEGEVTDAERM